MKINEFDHTKLYNDIILNEEISEPSIFSYIQNIEEISRTMNAHSVREKRNIEIIKKNILEVKRICRQKENKIRELEEQVRILEENKKK